MDSIMCYQGDTWPIAASLTDMHNSGLDLTSFTAYWSMKHWRTGSATDYIISAVSMTTNSSGLVSGSIEPSVTELIQQGRYYEELKVTDQNNANAVARFQRYRVVAPRVS